MTKPRARELGIPFEGETGKYNAITDVDGITVGYCTIIEGESARTGVTIIHPRGKSNHDPVFAGWFPFNGNRPNPSCSRRLLRSTSPRRASRRASSA